MSGFIANPSAAGDKHGVFPYEVQPPPAIVAEGTGVVGLVGQFPWGPDDRIVEAATVADRYNTLGPPGMSRTGTGWMAMLGKAWPDLRVVRVLGSAAARAEVTLDDSEDADCVTVTAKYKGTAGNSIAIVIANATDGDANHFNMTASVTGDSGTTTEIFENLNASGTGTENLGDYTNSLLLQGIAVVADGRPVNGSFTLASGADGTINSARYLGTPSAPDFGLSLFETDPEINIVFADDAGNTDRAAVNTGLAAHTLLMGDRMAVLNGNSGLSAADARTAAASNRSAYVAFADPWVYQYDLAGTERLVPSSSFLASAMANLPPSTAPSWRGRPITGIVRTETMRGGAVAAAMTRAGVCTIVKESGSYFFEASVTTIAPVTPSKKRIVRTRMGFYIADSLTESIQEFGDAPNVPALRQPIIAAVQRFMDGLKGNSVRDPLNLPHVLAWQFGDIAAANSQADIDSGKFTIPLRVKTSSGMDQIFLAIEYGETVQITVAEAA